jgi:hypothetical protein
LFCHNAQLGSPDPPRILHDIDATFPFLILLVQRRPFPLHGILQLLPFHPLLGGYVPLRNWMIHFLFCFRGNFDFTAPHRRHSSLTEEGTKSGRPRVFLESDGGPAGPLRNSDTPSDFARSWQQHSVGIISFQICIARMSRLWLSPMSDLLR